MVILNKPKRPEIPFEVIFHDGMLDGIRSYKNWLFPIITAYIVPRSLLKEAKKITEKNCHKRGVYYLIGNDDADSLTRFYIGQTRVGIERLDDHDANKDFWEKAVLFLTDEKSLSTDLINGLERHATIKAKEAARFNRYIVENKTNLDFEVYDYDVPILEKIYGEVIEFIMAALGYKLYDAAERDSNDPHYKTSRRGVSAFGKYSGEKFELLRGSQIDVSRECLHKYNEGKRQELLAEGNIVQRKSGEYYLEVNLEFKTPSGAGDFVLGGGPNGWTEWRREDNNKTLDELFRQKKPPIK